jgi:hypothetical protein
MAHKRSLTVETEALIGQARWQRPQIAETVASDRASASCYRSLKNLRVVPVIVTELKLRNVQRQVLFADLVEAAHDAALEEAPEALNGVCVDRAYYVLLCLVIHGAVLREALHGLVAAVLIGREQADLIRHGFVDEALERVLRGPGEHAGDNVPLALNRADDGRLAARATAFVVVPAVLVLGLAADPSLIDLDCADELLELFILQGSADAMAHVPGGLVGAEAHVAVNLPSADTFLRGQHKVDDAKPLPKVDVRILKDRPGDVGETIALRAAIRALPFELHGLERIDSIPATARATDTIGPAVSDEIGVAGIFVREGSFELLDGHLVDLPGLLLAGHDASPLRQNGDWHG